MKKYQCILLFFFVISACRFAQTFSFVSTPTPTPTSTATFTPTNTSTPTATSTNTPAPPTPTVTPIPLTAGAWRGVADGWNPPITISFNLTAEDNTYYLKNIVIFIPNIDVNSYFVQIRCTLKTDSVMVIDNGLTFDLNGIKVFDGQFDSPTSMTGNIYGGWFCEDKKANFGGEGSYVTWHAEWRK